MSNLDDVTGGVSPWGHSAPRVKPSGKRVGRPVRSTGRRRAAHFGAATAAAVAVVGPVSAVFMEQAGAVVVPSVAVQGSSL